MKNWLWAIALVFTSCSLMGCTTTGSTPYDQLRDRTVQAANMGNRAVAGSLAGVNCADLGMVAVEDTADIGNDTNVDYRENHGDGGGQRVNNGYNDFRTYNSATVQVRAETNSYGIRRVRCVKPISLSLSPAR
jgi:hypothetical protein